MIINIIKDIKYLPKKFKSDNKLDKYLSNFFIIIDNYSSITEIDYKEYILNILMDESKDELKYSIISAAIYLDYEYFIKLIKMGFKLDFEIYKIDHLLYKIFKHDNNIY